MVRHYLGIDVAVAEIKKLAHLSLWQRIIHPKSFKVLFATMLGTLTMFVASYCAVHSKEISTMVGVPHFIADAVAYLVHGIGAVPIVKYAEPVWWVFMGVEE